MMRALVLPIFLVVLWPAVALAQDNPAKCFTHPERWAYDRDQETLAKPGERFLDDMRACDSTFAAAVTEAVRYQIQAEEADKFARSRSYVLAAYGIAWALLAGSALAVWLRQRRLAADLAALEARLKEAEGKNAT